MNSFWDFFWIVVSFRLVGYLIGPLPHRHVGSPTWRLRGHMGRGAPLGAGTC
jgi:hypothetical protein